LLGPLTNPAKAQAQVLGVFSAEVVDLVAEALAELGTEHALVVHGAGKLDEISLCGPTLIAEVKGGSVNRYEVTPEDFAVEPALLAAIRGGSAGESAALIRAILAGESGPRRDIVVINAAAALVTAGAADSFKKGARMAKEALDSGAAARKLEEMRRFGASS